MKIVKKIWRKWFSVVRAVGNFQSQIIFALFYIVLFLPIGIWMHFFDNSIQPKKTKNTKTNFQDWSYPEQTLEETKHPY